MRPQKSPQHCYSASLRSGQAPERNLFFLHDLLQLVNRNLCASFCVHLRAALAQQWIGRDREYYPTSAAFLLLPGKLPVLHRRPTFPIGGFAATVQHQPGRTTNVACAALRYSLRSTISSHKKFPLIIILSSSGAPLSGHFQ